MPHSSLRPSQRLAPRCGQYWSMTPTTPRESRKASSSSPSTTIFFGGPSASGNSSESSTGSQKRRSNSPIGVPAPLSVRNLLSSARSMADLPESYFAFGEAWRRCGQASMRPRTWPLPPPAHGFQLMVSSSWFHVGPAPLFQLHDAHDAGLDNLRLRNDRNLLVLSLVHVLLGVATRFERDL